MRMLIAAGLVFWSCGSSNAAPMEAANSAVALQAGLTGHWSGALQYRDYQSDQLTSLPVATEIRVLTDGATEIEVSAFDDGPKSGTVFITTVSLFDPKSEAVRSASFRKGETPEIGTSTAHVDRYLDPEHWTVVYLHIGSDDDKPATIRTTQSRDGASVTTVEEYRPLAETGNGWKFRNKTRLMRVP